ncbi:MAG: hypothetical protein FD163_65 [Hyphomonadaceae bacterium]|nr:MAG: hypothetical protein FD128_475 [Hyphomonadaceae bacterium]KAF0186790.1 MAG: hypothetical protein FD163_65 [Hyphomonadaceae bacterium]
MAALAASLGSVAIAQVAAPTAPATEVSPAPVQPAPATPTTGPADAVAANEAYARGNAANTAGDAAAAITAWKQAYQLAPRSGAGLQVAMNSAKRLGFAMIDAQDLRSAEAYFAAEAIISRRLYFLGETSARRLSEAVTHWASGAGAMGRSNESAALVFYAQEIRARAQAAASSQILKRDAEFKADSVEAVRVNVGGLCVTSHVEMLASLVSCQDEAGARTEAVSMQSRQIIADAPPPPTKAERDAADAKKKKGDE